MAVMVNRTHIFRVADFDTSDKLHPTSEAHDSVGSKSAVIYSQTGVEFGGHTSLLFVAWSSMHAAQVS